MKKLFAILVSAPLLLSCAGGISVKDLVSEKKYVLQSVNGVAFASRERTPEIQFDGSMRVSGQVCNRFMGQGQLKGDVLTVPQMASTMMLCADPELNAMEQEFTSLLRQGAKVALRGDTLSLSSGTITYTYSAR